MSYDAVPVADRTSKLPGPDGGGLSRRAFVGGAAALAVGLAAPLTRPRADAAVPLGAVPATVRIPLDLGWSFGPVAGRAQAPATLPHVTVPLGYRAWPAASWEQLWQYELPLEVASTRGLRSFVEFDGVATSCTVTCNATTLGQHLGGYLPFSFEVTGLLGAHNTLGVLVDGTEQPQVPPGGVHPDDIDFLQPAGIHRQVALWQVPSPAFVWDIFVDPQVDAGQPDPEVQVTVDSLADLGGCRVVVELVEPTGGVVSQASTTFTVSRGRSSAQLTLPGRSLARWSPESPALYTARATLYSGSRALHTAEVSTGFRDVEFTDGGFYLNGRRRILFGLGRHELYPWAGHAVSDRAQLADATLLRSQLNLDFVRCAHYPHAPAFLDACDQLGLIVWEETPGWGNLGVPGQPGTADPGFVANWQSDVAAMVLRDRSRPSVAIWGALPNETDPPAPDAANAIAAAKALDPRRACAGAVPLSFLTSFDIAGDVSAVNDYEWGPAGGRPLWARLAPPSTDPGRPWLVTEAVGAMTFPYGYRPNVGQYQAMLQSLWHAEVHDIARNPAETFCGVSAWLAIDYQSTWGGPIDVASGLRFPGVFDTFRNPKRGAGFYQAQGDPRGPGGPVVVPAFSWQFDSSPAGRSVMDAPGPATPHRVAIWSNCDQVDAYLGGRLYGTLVPDSAGYPHLAHPPMWLDLRHVTGPAELTLVGMVSGRSVRTVTLDPGHAGDRLQAGADAPVIVADAVDSTRVWLLATDRYGNHRPYASGPCQVSVAGPAEAVGLGWQGFDLGDTGGSGAVWLRSAGPLSAPATVTVGFEVPGLGSAAVDVRLQPPSPQVTALDRSRAT